MREAARAAFRQFVWPITILTYRVGAEVRGVTISSVTSLSLDPPSIVLSIHRESRTAEHILIGRRFAVSLLGPSQVKLARRLAVPGGEKRLNDHELAITAGTEPPSLAGSIAALGVEIVSAVEVYSHLVVIALVLEVRHGRADRPLAYHDGRYTSHAPWHPRRKACRSPARWR